MPVRLAGFVRLRASAGGFPDPEETPMLTLIHLFSALRLLTDCRAVHSGSLAVRESLIGARAATRNPRIESASRRKRC
ncbi:hypothetical protein GCM10025771_03910 [Niveibacterium umoris]